MPRGFNKQTVISTNDIENEALPYFRDWQHIISDYVLNLAHYPLWKNVAFKFSIYRKCSPLLRSQLKNWYLSLLSHQNFEDLQMYLYDHPIHIPPNNNKRQTLDLKLEQEHILKYNEKYLCKHKTILSWKNISDNLGFDAKYTLSARQSLKKWYQRYYQEWMAQFQGNFSNSFSDQSTESLSSMKTVGSVDLIIDSKKQNLGQLLIQIFVVTQETVLKIITEPSLVNYYQQFFNDFSSTVIESSTCLQHQKIGLNQINRFHGVKNQKQFKHYFSSIPGLYAKMITWSILNPFPIENSSLLVHHHAMPKFLINTYGFSSAEIKVNYNLVKTSWIIHFLMHLVHMIEYGQPEDDSALRTFTQSKGLEKNTTIFQSWNPFGSLSKILRGVIKSHLLDNFPEFEQQIKQNREKGLRKAHLNRISQSTISVLSITTVWRSCYEYDCPEQIFEFVHQAQSPGNYSLVSLVNLLIYHYNKRNEWLDENKPELTSRQVGRRLGNYLAGKNRETSIYGFYKVNAKPPILPLSQKHIKKSRVNVEIVVPAE